MKLSVQWLRDFVTVPSPLESVMERLTLAGLEVKAIEPVKGTKDTVVEIEITPNRPDWLSHVGVAREIAAVENLKLKLPSSDKAESRPTAQGWKVNLRELEGCPYYTGVYMEGVPSVPTPDFIKERLAACGVRSIDAVVDITNYVLLETGQPLHAFDADLVRGQEIQVRKAKAGEKFTAINGTDYTLNAQDLVIADAERVVALAGVMGGKESEMTPRTRNVFLESAYFHPRWVRQTGRRLGISTESSYRFERRVDPEGVDFGRERAVALIRQHVKPRFISAVLKAGQPPARPKPVHITAAEIEKRLGAPLKSHQVASILTRLGFDAKSGSQDTWKIEVPSFRADVTTPVDLVEEVARIHGYDNLPETLPSRAPLLAGANRLRALEEKTRHFLAGLGLFETVTFSLISGEGLDPQDLKKEAVFVNNPLHKELAWMRPNFLPSLLSVVQKNISWGARRVALYEVANLYAKSSKKDPPVNEEPSVGILLYGKAREKAWADSERDFAYYDLKGILAEYLAQANAAVQFKPSQRPFLIEGETEEIMAGGKVLGFLGEVPPSILRRWDIEMPVFYAQLALEPLVMTAAKIRAYSEVPRYPAIDRDVALVVAEDVQAGEVEKEIRALGGKLVAGVELFDLFRGGRVPAGFKNLAFRIHYQSKEKTLVSEDIQKLHAQIAETLSAKFRASFQ